MDGWIGCNRRVQQKFSLFKSAPEQPKNNDAVLQHLTHKLRPNDKTARDDKRCTAVGLIFNRVIWAQRRSRVTSPNYSVALLSRMFTAGWGKTGDTSSLPNGERKRRLCYWPSPPPLWKVAEDIHFDKLLKRWDSCRSSASGTVKGSSESLQKPSQVW